MEISQVRSLINLVTLYQEKDLDRDGRLETDEVQGIASLDRNGDQTVSPWEVMEAVNHSNPTRVFSRQEINYLKQLNQGGKAFPPMQLQEGEQIEFGGRTYGAGSILEFDPPSGRLIAVSVVEDFTPPGTEGITFSNARYKYGENGMLTAIITNPLTESVTIDGKTYGAGQILEFNPSGQLEYATNVLSADFTTRGISIKAGSALKLKPDGQLVSATSLPTSNVTVHGIKFKAGKKLVISNFTAGSLTVDGTLAQDVTLKIGDNNVKFKAGTRLTYRYISNADPPLIQVINGTLAQDYTIPGTQITLRAGAEIFRNAEGRIERVKLSAATTIDGINFPAGSEVWLNAENRVTFATPGTNALIRVGDQYLMFQKGMTIAIEQGKVVSGTLINGTWVELREDGKIRQMKLGNPAPFMIGDQMVILAADTEISFNDHDKVEMITLGADAIIKINGEDVTFKAGTTIYLYPDGKIESGTILAKDHFLGLEVESEGTIYFRPDGQPEKFIVSETDETVEFDDNGTPYVRVNSMFGFLGGLMGRAERPAEARTETPAPETPAPPPAQPTASDADAVDADGDSIADNPDAGVAEPGRTAPTPTPPAETTPAARTVIPGTVGHDF